MAFTNYFDWSGVQPVTTQYYDMQDYTLCALADSATILPSILGPSALSTAAPPAMLPPSSFPPVFSGTIEALLSPPAANSSGVNGALILSQFREGSSTADGQWNWDENNQLQQLINSPAAPFASWYQFNHTVIGGVGGGSLWNLTAIDGNEAPYGGNAPPFACSWQWIAAANRSPLDYIHEQDLTKLWAMGNASLLLPLYSYNATVTVRGILVDQYLKQAVVHSPTDGNNYTYTQSIYVMHSGWQMQGRAGNGLLPPQSSMPVQIVTSGSYLSGGVAVPFTDYVNVFTIFPQASPFIFSPPSYNCQPPPRPSRPLFPSLQSVVAAGYYATVSLTSFYTSDDPETTFEPLKLPATFGYTEYFQSSPPLLRLDGAAVGVDWLQVIDLTSNVSTLAYNAALSMGALGYTAGKLLLSVSRRHSAADRQLQLLHPACRH